MVVRPLTEVDWPQLWPFLVAMGTPSHESESEARARFGSLGQDPRWLLVCAASPAPTLLGYAAVQDQGPHLRYGNDHRTARLHDLFVAPTARRQGVGRALMAHVVQEAARVARYLEWQAHQTRAAPFYERLGYHGEPCPQPDYPRFEVDFQSSTYRSP